MENNAYNCFNLKELRKKDFDLKNKRVAFLGSVDVAFLCSNADSYSRVQKNK